MNLRGCLSNLISFLCTPRLAEKNTRGGHGLVAVDHELKVDRVDVDGWDHRRPWLGVVLAQRVPLSDALVDKVGIDQHPRTGRVRALLD